MNLQEALSTIGVGSSTSYFTLKNHGDTKMVRFLYGTDPEKLDWFPVYKVKINNKDRYVLAPEQGEPNPFPKYNYKPTLRALLQLIVVDPNTGLPTQNPEVLIWDRGKTHLQQIALLMTKQLGGRNLCDVPISISRSGQAGSTQTQYNIIPRLDLANENVDFSNVAKKEKSEWAKDESSFILKLSYEDMVKVCQGTYAPAPKTSAPTKVGDMPSINGQNQPPTFSGGVGVNGTPPVFNENTASKRVVF